MALFLVQKKGTKKTLGVYHVMHDNEFGIAYFLIWEDNKWRRVDATDYEPLEFDNIYMEDSNADGLSDTR